MLVGKKTFPKSARILRKSTFKEFAHQSLRYTGRVLFIKYRSGTSPRLGITVTKKYGNAVHRNHFKRLVREAFREYQIDFPPIDLVVFPKKELDTSPSHCQVVEDIRRFVRHIVG